MTTNGFAMSNHTTSKTKPATPVSRAVKDAFTDALACVAELCPMARVDALRVLARDLATEADAVEHGIREEHEKRMGVNLSHLSINRGMWVRRVRLDKIK